VAERVRSTPIVALDVRTVAEAMELVDHLGDRCSFYKVGNELFTAEGPSIVRSLRERGRDVFLDLKFHDIPNTVAGGVKNAVQLGARLVTVHATGGRKMLDAAVRATEGTSTGILGVTVLTSLDATEIGDAWGRRDVDVGAEVLRLSETAASAGVHGVVCSGRETKRVTDRFGDRLAVLVPGVRAAGGAAQDQARVVTPREAKDAGARYLIIGRMVTAATDRRAAMDAVLSELA
jgi:orotidine-5'-phosphate decarboxylase